MSGTNWARRRRSRGRRLKPSPLCGRRLYRIRKTRARTINWRAFWKNSARPKKRVANENALQNLRRRNRLQREWPPVVISDADSAHENSLPHDCGVSFVDRTKRQLDFVRSGANERADERADDRAEESSFGEARSRRAKARRESTSKDGRCQSAVVCRCHARRRH